MQEVRKQTYANRLCRAVRNDSRSSGSTELWSKTRGAHAAEMPRTGGPLASFRWQERRGVQVEERLRRSRGRRRTGHKLAPSQRQAQGWHSCHP